MPRRIIPLLSLILLAIFTAPTLAQSSSGGATMSVFEMFVAPIPPNARVLDWIGVGQIWLILALSVVVIALVIQFAMRYRRLTLLPATTSDNVQAMLAEKRYRDAIEFANNDPSYLGKVLAAAMNEAGNGYSAMERAIAETGDAETTKMLRPLEYLNILANVGPMLGLFGTVYGIILAFNDLLAAGGKPDPAKLAGGISTALVTTFWGLIVAMPAVAAYALLRNKVDELTVEGMMMAEELIKPFKPGSAKKGATPAGDKSAAPAAARPMASPKPADSAKDQSAQ